MEPRDELPMSTRARRRKPRRSRKRKKRKPEPVRTAMSIENPRRACCAPSCRRSKNWKDYLELISVVEATAEEMQMQVHVEGYAPPFDPRVEVIKLTPDPA